MVRNISQSFQIKLSLSSTKSLSSMNSSICTLFEGSYHLGLASLINSLNTQGYKGEIYAGYRGPLPPWATDAQVSPELAWPNSNTINLGEGLCLHFLPLETDYHFTNYKPDFMLRLWDGVASDAKALFYFDPDIVVTAPWQVFEDWAVCGVALCEDVNSPKPKYHPVREAWRNYFGSRGFSLKFKDAIYANGGFVGLIKKNKSFLVVWKALQEAMAPAMGGLATSFIVTYPNSLPFSPFGIPDQDAMNAAVEAWDGPVSFINKSGMAFDASASLMSHAIGKRKPWSRNTLTRLIAGEPPRRADSDYWRAANGLIVSQPLALVWRRQIGIKIAALIGRFYRRN